MSYWLNGLGINWADSYAKPTCNMCNTYSELVVIFVLFEISLSSHFFTCSCYSLDKGGAVH